MAAVYLIKTDDNSYNSLQTAMQNNNGIAEDFATYIAQYLTTNEAAGCCFLLYNGLGWGAKGLFAVATESVSGFGTAAYLC